MSARKRSKKRRKDRFWRAHWREACILFASAVGLYAITIDFDFVLDDQIVISDNAFVKRGLDGIPDIFGNDSFTGYFGEQKDLVAGSRYRPLSIAMFAAEYEIAGADPAWYHAGNVLLYAFLCLLVFRTTALLLRSRRPKKRWFLAVPFIAALLFLLHPVHTEAVANIKGRDEILAMMAALGSLYASLRYVDKGKSLWLAASGLIFFIGLLAKENVITFLAATPAALYFFRNIGSKRILIAVAPLLAAAIAYILLRIDVIGFLFSDGTSQDLMNNPFVGMSVSDKYATITYTLGLYLKLLFFPHPLTHDYYPYHIPVMQWKDAGVLLTLATYAALIAIFIYGLRRKSVVSFCIFFFIATISIVSNVLFPIGTFMNERFLFMPSFAFCLGMSFYGDRAFREFERWKWIGPAILGAYIAGFTYKSIDRIPDWRDAMSLNRSAVTVSENSARANCFMGTALYAEGQDIADRQTRFDYMLEAEHYIDRSLEIYPKYLSANQMKSGFLAEHYRYDGDLDKLLSGFETILANKPNVQYIPRYCEYLNGRGNVDRRRLKEFYYRVSYEIMLLKHRSGGYSKKYVQYGLQLDPNDAKINWAAGKIYRAIGEQQTGDAYLSKAYQLDPTLPR